MSDKKHTISRSSPGSILSNKILKHVQNNRTSNKQNIDVVDEAGPTHRISRIKVYEYMVQLSCDGCSKSLHKTLDKVKGVRHVEIDYETQVVQVTVDAIIVSAFDILEIMRKSGKVVEYINTKDFVEHEPAEEAKKQNKAKH